MPRRNQKAEDEAYAQALQEEYRREFIRRQADRIGNGNATSLRDPEAGDGLANNNRSRSNSNNNNGNTDNDNDNNNSNNKNKNASGKRRKKGKGKKKSKGKSNKTRSRSSSRDSAISDTGRENRRRRRRRSVSEKASSPILSGDDWLSTYHPEQSQSSTPAPATNATPLPPPYVVNNYDPTGGDEEYARMVQDMISREEEDAERQRSEEGRNQRSILSEQPIPVGFTGQRGIRRQISFKDSTSSGGTEPSTDDDEAVARKIQQELADAEYAERISNLEREDAASRDVVLSLERQNQLNLSEQQQQQDPPKSCLVKWGPSMLCIIVAVTVPLLYLFDVFDSSDFPFWGDLFQDDWAGAGNITFDMINGTLVPRLPPNAIGWATKGIGLRLDVLNACSDEWQPFVQTAIANWENGNPIDSLTLYSSRVEYDLDCQTVNGKLKICNGDYGDTQWRGLNEVMMNPRLGLIVASTAKLNEFYLNYENDAQKLYTCCHELGHGFGLPHWDENFFNKDLGNCMDYTQNPEGSSKPDQSNFLYLAQLYGGLDVSTNIELTADDAVMAFGEKEETNSNTGSGSNEKIELGVRNLFGTSGPLRYNDHNNRRGNITSIPFSESRLRFDNTLPGPPATHRRILHADESAEIHVFEDPKFPGYIFMQHFLLVEDGWSPN